ncbi:MAG: phosphotransferase [Isosphaeraceae bacterium]
MDERVPTDLLRLYPSHVQPIGSISALGNAGGLSGARLWRYRSDLGEMACRAWPTDGPTPDRLATIHRWLDLCRALRFVPIPVAALDGTTFHVREGRLWELAPWLPGAPCVDQIPGRARLVSALQALARVHVALSGETTRSTSPGLARRVRELQELECTGFARIAESLQGRPDDPIVPLARRWMTLARVQVPRLLPWLLDRSRLEVTLQPCFRDARPEHFLFEGDSITGLVDFGAMGIETVAVDLARLLGEWLDGSPAARAEVLAAYADVRPLDDSELALIEAFAAVADVLIAGHWISWTYLESRRFDSTASVTLRVRKGLARLERLSAATTPSLPGPR